ncbi:phospholipase A [Noviherbaspirillum aridicola]|uniref:Phospholipase A1 n=1 Tax=Noviherbaspirillum aridicola TaxID=2849687 RepID=A0ABQ4Q0B1_9BURK|nr:phospholipase A [Noviherbaspirillum aridicola]GIZ50215.1 phospholipase [Noviherbaspirillum aridicola]
MKKKLLCGALAGLFASACAWGQEVPTRLEACAAIADDRERLSCYDRLARGEPVPEQERAAAAVSPQPESPALAASTAAESGGERGVSYLSRYWELDAGDKRGIFHFRPHRENYLIATYNDSPNVEPYRPLRLPGRGGGLANAELKFQIGFKLKIAENPANLPVDFWFGYTQTSYWQANNREASSPFRETNYQPEVMAVVPLNLDLLGLKLRFINAGFVHESNGQGSVLSRSWNRSYLQAGFERGNFSLLARAWKRVNESADEDDNPDIVDYMGRGDLVGTWRSNGHEVSLLTRYNFSTDKGAMQIGWAFPLAPRLKGYVQYFTGYGHSLIDYNAHQRVMGLGVLVTY